MKVIMSRATLSTSVFVRIPVTSTVRNAALQRVTSGQDKSSSISLKWDVGDVPID